MYIDLEYAKRGIYISPLTLYEKTGGRCIKLKFVKNLPELAKTDRKYIEPIVEENRQREKRLEDFKKENLQNHTYFEVDNMEYPEEKGISYTKKLK